MIFAAGIGSRLKPFTLTHPKALAPVARRPALQWAIDNLGNTAVDKLVVNTHHFAEQVKDYINGITTEKLPIEQTEESPLLRDTRVGLLKTAPLQDS
ncbi:MAG: NTP transferase domain-containing protein, partial [Muribaculaceae bacterium]|nr:NTP transferase domain-containing protein [Muribaculaceae bacterium]